jgi:pimeloyl-ACP methyl ester carboxylesterase
MKSKFRMLLSAITFIAGLALLFAALTLPAMMLLGLSPSARAQAGLKTYTGEFPDGATYVIDVPPDWNGTLFLYSHGYTIPGTPNPAPDTGDLLTRLYLLSHNYALAGSSYAKTGYAIEDALRDQIAVLNKFDSLVGHPSRTIAWGHSLGGIISAGLVQNHPDRFSGAVCLCGVLAGSVGAWNEWLDSAFAFNTLLASGSGLKIVDITDPIANLGIAETVLSNAQATPQGQARIALAAALVDSSGWIDPFSPQPNPKDYATLEANQFLSLQGFPFALFFAFRAELEGRAGGNPSWNTGVDYARQLKLSVNYAEVQALYKLAGLSLDADLQALNNAARIAADPAAVNYLSQNIIFNGELKVPVLTVHTTGDDIVTVQNEQAYAEVVHEAHDDSLLRETFVHRAGHVNFTPAETIAALQALIRRLDTGEWQGIDPASLNAAASGLPPVYNFLFIGASVHSPAAFIDYTPAPYQRPFDAFDQRRGSNNSAVTVSSGLSAAAGGVYNTGTLTILSDTLSGNTAEENFFHEGSGGGIFNDVTSRTLPPSLMRRMSQYRFPGHAFSPRN